jgi:hypothetical protein
VPGPTLEIYYAQSCAPCRLELPAISELVQKEHAPVHFFVLDGGPESRRTLGAAAPGATITDAASRGGERKVLAAAGDTDAILPYARAVGLRGELCAAWRGRLTVSVGVRLLAQCPRVSARRSR